MNTIKKVTMFCASIVLSFCFCGCSSDDDENTNSSSNEKKLVKIVNEGTTTIFNYDNQGRLRTVKRSGDGLINENYSYVWSDNNESVKVLDNSGEDFELRIVDGLVISGYSYSSNQTLIFTYDNSRLSSYDFGSDYKGSITWGKNGISEATILEGEIIYSGKSCKGYNPYMVYQVSTSPIEDLAVAQPRLFGLHVNQLPEKIKGDENDEVSFSYEFDKEGYLVKLTATYHGNYNKDYNDGESEIYEYTWK